MRRLSLYVLRQLAVAASMTTAGLTFAIWLSQSLRLLDIIVNRGLSLGLALKFLLLLLPGLISLLLPVAVFIAVMFVYHRLNADSEIVVMRTAGVSDLALARPVVVFGLVSAAIIYLLTLFAIPASMRNYHDIQRNLQGNMAGVLIEPGVFTDLSAGVTIFAHTRDRSGAFAGIIVDDARDRNRRLIYTAEHGAIDSSADGPIAILQDGTYQETDKRSGKVSVLYFKHTTIGLGSLLGRSTGPRPRSTEELYLPQLLSGNGETDPLSRGRLLAEAHRRLAEPLYPLALALIAASSLIGSGLPRQSQNLQMLGATLGASLLLILSFVMRSLTLRFVFLGPVAYVVPTLTIGLGLWLLMRKRGLRARLVR
jgi:lipopolysaccharide export system permease protein